MSRRRTAAGADGGDAAPASAPDASSPSRTSSGTPSEGVLRVTTAVVGLPVVVAAAWFGGAWFALLVMAAALGAQVEVYRLARASGATPGVAWGLVAGAGVALTPLVPEAHWVTIAALVGFLAWLPFRPTRTSPVVDLAATLGGVVYPTALLTLLTAVRLDLDARLPGHEAAWATLAVFLLVAIADTCAYYTGRAFGKTPLAPSVSPKKTWEGAAGGAVGAVAAALAFSLWLVPSVPVGAMVALGVVAGVVSPLGDLAESRMKRAAGVKDSGHVLPGHGGLLDRLDALLVAAPLAYLIFAVAYR